MTILLEKKALKCVIMGIILIALGLLGGSLYIKKTAVEPKNLPNSSKSHKKMVNFYQKWLISEENALWNQLEAEYGIVKGECERVGKEVNEDPQNEDQKPVSLKVAQIMKNIVSDFMLPFDVIAMNDNQMNALARASKSFIFINEDRLPEYSECAHYFLIGHEVRHILHKDADCLVGLEVLLNKKAVVPSDDPADLYNRFRRFIELRADIETALVSPIYAQGLIETMDIFTKGGRPGRGITHPLVSTRRHVGTKLLAAHQKVAAAILA